VDIIYDNGSIQNEINDPKNGKYKCTYKSGFARNGICEIKILVKQKNIPKNKATIKTIEKELKEIPLILNNIEKDLKTIKNEQLSLEISKENVNSISGHYIKCETEKKIKQEIFEKLEKVKKLKTLKEKELDMIKEKIKNYNDHFKFIDQVACCLPLFNEQDETIINDVRKCYTYRNQK